ncbi:hypothetical protein WHZ78_06905 [Bradyrhizobium symbiodeficiens]|uniref:hypothetical protein n=1 Tax=Bradyrhizobium symbiodeficiens TaxID=1404367 RepID=UPI0030D55B98
MMTADCAALVTRLLFAHVTREIAATLRGILRTAQAIQDVHQSGDRAPGCVAKQRDDQAWSRGRELKCRIPPASNVKKKQEFA